MALGLGFIVNAGTLALLGVEVSNMIGGQAPSKQSTIIHMVVGSGHGTMGGHIPHIALWNEQGKRLGQYNPKGKKKDPGAGHTVAIEHNQGPENDAAGYIMLSNRNNDAICISAIFITDENVSTAWYGDYGKECDMSWGISKEEIGSEHATPHCVWLDGDNTNGINAQAMSFHIKDMVGSYDRQVQYADVPDTMCRSTARFSYWGDLEPDSRIPFFKPELEYNKDSQSGGTGTDKDLFRVLDLSKHFDKSTYMYRGGDHGLPTQEDYDWLGGYCEENDAWGFGFCPERPDRKREAQVDSQAKILRDPKGKKSLMKRRPYRAGISDRLIITGNPSHSAKQLCESETSYGPDTASISEGLFCDMETKTLYPFCHKNSEEVCFDVATKQLLLENGEKIRQGRATIPKAYNSVDNW